MLVGMVLGGCSGVADTSATPGRAAAVDEAPAPGGASSAPVTPAPASVPPVEAGATAAARPPVSRPAPPRELALPSGTTAPIRLADVAASGELSVPDDSAQLGWWVGGSPLGASAGVTLVAGHVDTAEFGLGVFAELEELSPGDTVTLTDGLGARHDYVVTGASQVQKTELPGELFDAGGPPRLALVTCGGPFDRDTGRYRDNVIVWADPVATT